MPVIPQSEAVSVRLRHAVPGDEDFLLQLFIATQPVETMYWNVDATTREQLLRMQFRGRGQTYAAEYPDAENLIVCLQEEGTTETRIGRHLIERQNNAILGIDLAILPAYQGRGYGRQVLQEVQRQCAAQGLRFSLQVLHTNPARRLYDRLGFTMVSHDQLYAQMEWIAPQI